MIRKKFRYGYKKASDPVDSEPCCFIPSQPLISFIEDRRREYGNETAELYVNMALRELYARSGKTYKYPTYSALANKIELSGEVELDVADSIYIKFCRADLFFKDYQELYEN